MKQAFSKLAGLLAVVLLLSALCTTALAADTTLSFTVPEGVSFQLYKDFTTTTKVTATATNTADGITTHSFANLAAGNYCYQVSGTGYYTVKKNVYYSAAEAAVGSTIDANPGKIAGTGFEPVGGIVVNDHTDELMAGLTKSTADTWPDYAHISQTPYFTREDSGKGKHQQTTQSEMMDFLRSVEGESDHSYLYILGKSPTMNYEIPMIVFTTTDLSGADTVEEAAELIKGNGKLTIHYQAQIHGNEPGGGEGALAMIKQLAGEYGEEVLDTVNIYVIPRINVEGSDVYTRNNVDGKVNMNRDFMRVESKELTMVRKVIELFEPEVSFDGHEFNGDATSAVCAVPDAYFGIGGSLNIAKEINDTTDDMVRAARKSLREQNLRPYYYPVPYADPNNTTARAYLPMMGCINVLVETRGINFGMNMFERRVVVQYIAMEALIDYTVKNVNELQDLVDTVRADIIKKGEKFDENELLTLQNKRSGVVRTDEEDNNKYNQNDGSLNVQQKGTHAMIDTAAVTRVRPTAYVLPKGSNWVKTVLEIMDKHAIDYYELGSGVTIELQQYKGDGTRAELLDETPVTFPNGAYVFPMNQVGGTVLAMLMEPDVPDNIDDETKVMMKGTLVQSKVISPAADGRMPIYRYCHDLVDGKVEEYVPVSCDGNHNGWTAVTAVSQIKAAGKYYLNADITTQLGSGAFAFDINGIGDVVLCLNGHHIKPAAGSIGGSLLAVQNKSKLELRNCQKTGSIDNSGMTGRIMYVDATSSAVIQDGVHLKHAHTTRADRNAPVQVHGTLDMTGGSITGTGTTAHAAANAGAVWVNGGKFNLSGGIISGNIAKAAGGAFRVDGGGRLTMSGDAIITGNTAKGGGGGGVYITGGGTFLMEGGIITSNKHEHTGNGGGGVSNDGGTFTMTGGTISGNSCKNNGGGVYNAAGTTTISGGSIVENQGSLWNGGVAIYNGTLNITGGIIRDNTVQDAKGYGTQLGVGINTTSNCNVTISGGVISGVGNAVNVMSNTLTIKDGCMITGNLGTMGAWSPAKIDIQGGVIKGDVTNAMLVSQTNLFTEANRKACTVTISGGSISGKVSETTASERTAAVTTTVSGGYFGVDPSEWVVSGEVHSTGLKPYAYRVGAALPTPGTCGENHVGWTPISSASEITASGKYYLTNDIIDLYNSEKFCIQLYSAVDVTLCLNGHSIVPASKAGSTAVCVEQGGKLELINCKDTGVIDNSGMTGRLMYVGYSSTATINDGVNLKHAHTTRSDRSAPVMVQGGTLNMKGGSIIGTGEPNPDVAMQAGALWVESGTFNMYGGTISGNISTGYGGGVYNNGTFNMYGGTITGNRTTGSEKHGGGVYNNATFNMYGGTISGNTATSRGMELYTAKNAVIGGGTIGAAADAESIFSAWSGTLLIQDDPNYADVPTVNGSVICYSGTTTLAGGCFDGVVKTEGANGKLVISGGKYSALTSKDALMNHLDSTIGCLSVTDIDENGFVYLVKGQLYSEAADKFMDFGSSLDLGVILNAHGSFDPAVVANEVTASAVSANKTYGTSFDTTTVPGVLILMAHGIAAKEMHDDITFTVKKGDEVWFEETLSVYEVAQLWHGDAETDDQRMLADMIAYGNAARKEFKYNYAEGDELPELTGASSNVSRTWKATEGAGVSNGQAGNVAVTLSLKDQIELNIYINDKAAQVADVKLGGRNYADTRYAVDTNSGAYTRIRFFDIPVVDVKKPVEFTVTTSDGTEFTVKYSIMDYVINAQDGAQRALIQELMQYVDSVSAYLGVPDIGNDPGLSPEEDETDIINPWKG